MSSINHLILDGGLATELESRGHRLNDDLWSARLIKDAPQDIKDVHLDYLEAGADIITSASYQATIRGFTSAGFDHDGALDQICNAVKLACEARDEFAWNRSCNARFDPDFLNHLDCESWFEDGRLLQPLVAASIGPYGAFLANGAEFTGDYDLDPAGLEEFHRERWNALAETSADLMLCETVPSFDEAKVLAGLASRTESPVLISFSCRNETEISDGTPLAGCALMLREFGNVKAIGINCTSPRFIDELIGSVRAVCELPIVVYPNSGETFDGKLRQWTGDRDAADFGASAKNWHGSGAAILGGCCRTGPDHIRSLIANLGSDPQGEA